MKKTFLENNSLFTECLEALNSKLLSREKSHSLEVLFEETYPITKWGKIDWKKIKRHKELVYLNDIIPTLQEFVVEKLDENAQIHWSDGGLLIIESNLTTIINNYGDIDCVAFDKFIFNLSQRYIIEVLFSGRITVGVLTN